MIKGVNIFVLLISFLLLISCGGEDQDYKEKMQEAKQEIKSALSEAKGEIKKAADEAAKEFEELKSEMRKVKGEISRALKMAGEESKEISAEAKDHATTLLKKARAKLQNSSSRKRRMRNR